MKNILLGIVILYVSLSFTVGYGELTRENGKLSGVVTYKDYYELSNHADVGCEIYAINEADVISTQYDKIEGVIGNFQRTKSEYSLSLYSSVDLVRIKKAQDNFDAASSIAFKYISGLKQSPAVVKAATNGSGEYKLRLRPGRYYILVTSGSVKSNNIVESKGNIAYKIVDIRSAGETLLDLHFEKSENTLIQLITAWQQQGC